MNQNALRSRSYYLSWVLLVSGGFLWGFRAVPWEVGATMIAVGWLLWSWGGTDSNKQERELPLVVRVALFLAALGLLAGAVLIRRSQA